MIAKTKPYDALALRAQLETRLPLRFLIRDDVRMRWVGSFAGRLLIKTSGSSLIPDNQNPIIFVGANWMTRSNQRFRGLSSLSNILSFRGRAKVLGPSDHDNLLICCNIIYAEAIKANFRTRDYYLKLMFRGFGRFACSSSSQRG